MPYAIIVPVLYLVVVLVLGVIALVLVPRDGVIEVLDRILRSLRLK
jgi:hypothetical protein